MDRSHCINWITATSGDTDTGLCVDTFKFMVLLLPFFNIGHLRSKQGLMEVATQVNNSAIRTFLPAFFLHVRLVTPCPTMALLLRPLSYWQWNSGMLVTCSACGWWPEPNKSHGWLRWIGWGFKFFCLCSCLPGISTNCQKVGRFSLRLFAY